MKILLVLPLIALSALVQAFPENRTFEERSPVFHYRDDRDGRALAEIHVRRVERDGEPTVEIVISAEGANIDPVAGYPGVRGANRHTAEAFEHMLSGRFPVRVETRRAGGETFVGSIRAGRRGTIAERVVGPDGQLEPAAGTPREYPLELVVDTHARGSGSFQTDVLLHGATRLRVGYRILGNQLEILAISGFGDARHHPRNGEAALLAAQQVKDEGDDKQKEEEEKPLPPPVTDADWDARDLEGKWALFSKSKADFIAWRQYLDKRKDFAFLEWIALYSPHQSEQLAAGWTLARNNAPQWTRVAVWLREAYPFAHGEAESYQLLVKHNPAYAHAYLDKHREVVAKKDGPLRQDLEEFRKKNVAKVNVDKALPPFEHAEVFRHLDAPKDLAEFGNATRADSGKVYVHQVTRAVKAVVTSGRHEEPWIGKVRLLTRHRHLDVRQSAYLAFTYFAPDLEAKTALLDQFLDVAEDKSEPPAIRDAALLAYSYFNHPQVFLKLHHLAGKTDNAIWRAVVSRLGDVGHDFTHQHLSQIPRDKLGDADRELLLGVLDNLARRMKERDKGLGQPGVRAWLETAAWAEHVDDP
ncbi:MAG: hypothetical protein L0Y70_02410, partial [Gemmataceae bacterium]|nr:hypothetical protein [Gemmataceae bacterium]